MPDHSRVRALDEVQKDPGWKTKWKTFNALFRNFTPIFDDVFDRGSAPDLDTYVNVKMADGQLFAERLIEDLLGLQQAGRHEGRVYLLRGDVGRGKSIFSRHLVREFIPKNLPRVIAVYADAFDMVQGNDPKGTNSPSQPKTFAEFRESVRSAVIAAALISHKDIFKDECGLFRLLLKSKGYALDSDYEVLAARNQIDLDEILDFLSEFKEVDRIVIVVDNLDECSKEILDLTRSLVRSLPVRGSSAPRAQKVAVLLPLRNYSINRFGDTKRYAIDDLPEADYSGVFARKIDLLRQLIKNDARTYAGEVSSAAFSRSTREHSVQKITYKVGPESIGYFLNALSKYLLTAHTERDFAPFLKSLCAGNCKYLVAGLYNFLHSCKLPLTSLFEQAFLPERARTDEKQSVPLGSAVECLMTIHFPFFDVDASSICNVFNAADQRSPNYYQNTLVIPRLLARLNNAEQVLPYGRLRQDFRSLGYHQDTVDAAFEKVSKFGLVAATEGYRIENWNEETGIGATTAARIYVQVLIGEMTYLQYVSEDVPMPEEFVVPIHEKYGSTLIGSGAKNARLKSVSRLIDFIESEERLERESIIGRKRLKEDSFLEKFGIKSGGEHLRLSGYIRQSAGRDLKRAESPRQ